MNQQKGLLTHLGEALDHYRAEQRATAQPSRPRWLGRQLMPNLGTLLLVAVLILTQNVWARQAAAPNAPGPSATTVNYQGRLADDAGDPPIPAGAALFALARSLFHLGIHAATGAPDGTNAAAWAASIAS
jgi:hypothetical protein